MDERNQEVLALAFKRARAKSAKINELAITAKMTKKAIDELIVTLAKAKDPAKWETHIKGQRWYVEDLVAFAKLGASDRLEYEYAHAFPELASEDEMLADLEALVA